MYSVEKEHNREKDLNVLIMRNQVSADQGMSVVSIESA